MANLETPTSLNLVFLDLEETCANTDRPSKLNTQTLVPGLDSKVIKCSFLLGWDPVLGINAVRFLMNMF